jgi:peptide/nickel transport system substrate-binding protein
MNQHKKISRRRFITISATTGVASIVAACSAPATPTAPTAAPAAATTAPAATAAQVAATAAPVAATAAPAAATGGFKEAPMLAELVKAGTLPPVAERIPAKPMVIQTLQELGQYGGTWRMGMEEDDNVMLVKTMLYDGLVRWNSDWTAIEPNLAESWEVENDGAKYTFKLREGVRWSDGKPFTTADIMFWVEEVRKDDDLHGDQPGWMQVLVDGEDVDAKVTAIDDYTISFEWPVPNGLFLQRLAIPNGLEVTHYHAEYSKQFMPKFNPDADKQAKEKGLPGWIEQWEQMAGFDLSGITSRNQNPELPTLFPWRVMNRLGEGQSFNAERNPYYWKVDQDGQQLPYIDKLTFQLVSDREVLLLNALNGEIDMQDRRIGDLRNKPVLAEGREKGDFRFFETFSSSMNVRVITFNMAHKDPVKREIFNNKTFRQALSIAINRQNIIDTVYVSQGQPWQAAPHPESIFADQEMGTQFTEYSVDEANKLLDEAGYAKGADGMRTGPDGKTIEFTILMDGKRDEIDLVINDWKAIGINAVSSAVERTLFRERTKTNDHDATAWNGNGGNGFDVVLLPSFYMPFDQESHWAMPWQLWFNSPDEELAEEPPAPYKKQMELYRQLRITASQEEQNKLMQEIIAIAKEEFPVIGLALPVPAFGIVRNSFVNVPDKMFDAYNWPQPGAARPEQFFIRTT